VAWINDLHDTLTECVPHFDGVPVKYLGDGATAFFSGPQMAHRAV